jgi:AraC-like DNA-binding protein
LIVGHRPKGPLSQYVDQLWYCEGYRAAHARERVLPNGRFQVIIDLADRAGSPIVLGLRSQHSVIETAAIASVIGVLFQPDGACALLAPPADDFYNRAVPLDLLWGTRAGELRDTLREAPTPAAKLRLLAAELERRLPARSDPHAAVRQALAEFRRVPHLRRVLEVTKDTGLSRRRFAQLFREQIGMTPKLYCRLSRFQQVVRQIASGRPVDWADVSLAGGYCDQAHMANEFREFAGISPGAWLAGEHPFPNHMRMA